MTIGRNPLFVILAAGAALYACAGMDDASNARLAPVKTTLQLAWPEGVSYDKASGQLFLPPSILAGRVAATAPVYLTGAEITLSGEGLETFRAKVDVQNAVASYSVQPGLYTITVTVYTNIGLTFTGAESRYLNSGDNGTITMVMEVNSPPTDIIVSVNNPFPLVGETVTLGCKVTDLDGDLIIFKWSGGGLYASGPVVKYTVPDALPRTFTCTADDTHGGILSGHVSITPKGPMAPPPPPDTIPPVTLMWVDALTAPIGAGSWHGSAKIDEVGNGFCAATLLPAPAPTSAAVKAGGFPGQVGTRGSVPLAAGAAATCVITGLAPGTQYKFYFVAIDPAGNLQATPSVVTAMTSADVTPPVTSNWSDALTALPGSGQWIGKATINEGGTGWCVAYTTGSPAPAPTSVKTGALLLGRVGAQGTVALTAATPGGCVISGLTPGVTYDFYFVAQDLAGNLQFTNAMVTAPAP